MRDSKSSGKKPIKEVQELRARKPKLERVSSDITERKKAEDTLPKSEQEYKTLFESTKDGIIRTDMQGKILDANKAYLDMLGYSMEEIRKLRYQQITPEKWHQMEAEIVKNQFIKRGYSDEYEKEYIKKDGTIFPISLKGWLVKDEQRQPVGMWGFVRDITERKKAEEELRQSKEFLVDMIDALDDPVFVKDEQHRWVILNDAACKVMGRSREELIGKSDNDLFSKQQADVFWQRDDFVLKSGRTDINEEEITWHGKLHTISTKKSLFTDSVTGKKFVVGTIRDITERKKAEEEIEAGKKKLETYIESMVDGVAVADSQNRLIQANKALAELLGYDSVNEMLGIDTADLVPKREMSRIVEAGKECIKKGTLRNFETIALRKDGWEVPVQLNATALKDPSGKLVGNMSVIRDITERKQAEEALRKSEEKYRTLYETTRDGIAGGPMDGRILEYNQAFADMLGYSREELTNLTYQQLTPKRWHQMEAEIVQEQILKRGYSDEYEKEYIKKDGTLFPISAKVWLRKDKNGKPVGMWGIVRDITERKRAEEALHESEEKYRSFVQDFQGIAYRGNMNFVPVFFHGAVKEITGYTEEEFAAGSLRWDQIICADDRPKIYELAEKVRAAPGNSTNAEYRIVRKDGSMRWVNDYIHTVGDESGQVVYVDGTIHDITERKRMEDALRRSKTDWENTFNAISDWVVLMDLKGRILRTNRAGEEFVGVPMAQMAGQTCCKLLHGSDAPLPGCPLLKMLRTGRSETIELQLPDSNRWVAVAVDPVVDEKGTLVGAVHIASDITERKRAEEEIMQIKESYDRLTDNADEAIFTVEADGGHVIYANSAAERIFGYSKAEWAEDPSLAFRMIHPDYAEKQREYIKQINTTKKTIKDVELGWIAKDGREVIMEYTIIPIIDESDKVIRFESIGRDITERKKAKQRLLEDQVKLKSLTSQLTLAEERERRRIATELHDRIGQSLVISKMNLEALRKSSYGQEFDRTLDEICNTLCQTIADTRTLTFDLSSPILYELGFETAVAEWLTEQIQDEHGIATQFEDDGRPKPLGDDIGVLLFRNVRELLMNVVRHARAKKTKVSIRRVGKKIQVSVEDDGVGFDPAKAASTAAKRAEFGLFSIRQRLEELGGHLEIDSEPGLGCKVTMTAPLKQE